MRQTDHLLHVQQYLLYGWLKWMRTFRVSTGLTVKRDERRDQNWVKLLVPFQVKSSAHSKRNGSTHFAVLFCVKTIGLKKLCWQFFFFKPAEMLRSCSSSFTPLHPHTVTWIATSHLFQAFLEQTAASRRLSSSHNLIRASPLTPLPSIKSEGKEDTLYFGVIC